jgi:hypothetical protein
MSSVFLPNSPVVRRPTGLRSTNALTGIDPFAASGASVQRDRLTETPQVDKPRGQEYECGAQGRDGLSRSSDEAG